MSIRQYIGFACIITFIFFVTYSNVLGQKDHVEVEKLKEDSVIYFADYSHLLAFRIYTNTKWNTLDIIKENQSLRLRPNSPTSLGLGFNYKEYGLALAIGIPKGASSNKKYGKTNRFDLQANVYGKKIGLDGLVQFYKGYYLANPQDFTEWECESYPQFPDMKIYSIGLNAFYIFNSKKFAYKAAFVRNQIQRKSSGSFICGVFGQLDVVETDQGFIPMEFPDSILRNFDLKSFNTLAIGLTAGYLYTWVISEKFFFNVGVAPGFGLQTIKLETIDGQKSTKNAPAGQLTGRSALGFDSKYFYAGITGMIIWRNFEYKGYDLDLATEQLKVFIGKRFDLSKKLKPPR